MNRDSRIISIALRTAGVIVGVLCLLLLALDMLAGTSLIGIKTDVVFGLVGGAFLFYGITGKS